MRARVLTHYPTPGIHNHTQTQADRHEIIAATLRAHTHTHTSNNSGTAALDNLYHIFVLKSVDLSDDLCACACACASASESASVCGGRDSGLHDHIWDGNRKPLTQNLGNVLGRRAPNEPYTKKNEKKTCGMCLADEPQTSACLKSSSKRLWIFLQNVSTVLAPRPLRITGAVKSGMLLRGRASERASG
jgi:hypothetical protein